MKKELNLPCLYKVFLETEDSIYTFITKNNIEYKIAFEIADYIPIRHLYSMSIIANIDHPPMDVETKNTISEIIKYFFRDEQKSIIYLCAFDDEKAFFRFEKFNRWFHYSDFKNELCKINGIIHNETIYYSSIIFHQKNIEKDTIIEKYNLAIRELNLK